MLPPGVAFALALKNKKFPVINIQPEISTFIDKGWTNLCFDNLEFFKKKTFISFREIEKSDFFQSNKIFHFLNLKKQW